MTAASTAPLSFEGLAPRGVPEGVLLELWREGGSLGQAVRHGDRIHGITRPGAVSGPVEMRVALAATSSMPCELLAAEARIADIRVQRSGRSEREGARVQLVPSCGGEEEIRKVHSCVVEAECAGGGLAMGGALAVQWSLRADAAGAVHWAVYALALRPLVLEDGLGLQFEGVAWPFAAAAERLTRGPKGWQVAGSGASSDVWPLSLGSAGQLLPRSPWHLWFEHAERLEDGSFRLLVLPCGTRLEAGESRLFRSMLTQNAGSPAASALLLAAEPLQAATPFEQIVRAQVRRFLEDEVHGLRSREPDAGDWMHHASATGNLEYDSIGGLLAHGEKWGDERAIAAALAARDHLLSVDLAPSRGFPFEHGAGHRAGHHEAGHHWMWGLLAARRSHPDALVEALLARLCTQQEREFECFDPQRELERSTGWGLLALAETRRANVLAKSGQRALARISRIFTSRPWGAGWVAPAMSAAKDRTLLLESFEQGIHLLALDALAASGSCDAARERANRLAARLEEDALRADEEGRLQLCESIAVERGSGRTLHVIGTQRASKALLVLAALARGKGPRGAGRAKCAEESALLRFQTEARKFTGEDTALLLFAERVRDARLSRRGG